MVSLSWAILLLLGLAVTVVLVHLALRRLSPTGQLLFSIGLMALGYAWLSEPWALVMDTSQHCVMMYAWPPFVGDLSARKYVELPAWLATSFHQISFVSLPLFFIPLWRFWRHRGTKRREGLRDISSN